jgi:ATP-dependent RNA helicase DDX31/DBP7
MLLLPGPEEGYVDAVLKKGGQPVNTDIGEVFKKGFGDGKQREWEDTATQWQMAVERWVLEDSGAKEMATRAWVSHIRAYTTHIAAEKGMFNYKMLHYGHLAKSCGLRDTPGNMRLPGPGAGIGKGKKDSVGGKRGLDTEETGETAGKEAVRKMRKVAFGMQMKKGMSSEFNLA